MNSPRTPRGSARRSLSGTPTASPTPHGTPRAPRLRLSAPALGSRRRSIPDTPPRPEAPLGFYTDKPVPLNERPPFKVSKSICSLPPKARSPGSPYKKKPSSPSAKSPRTARLVAKAPCASPVLRPTLTRSQSSGIPKYTGRPATEITAAAETPLAHAVIATPKVVTPDASAVVVVDIPCEVTAGFDLIITEILQEDKEVVVLQGEESFEPKEEHPLIKELKAKLQERAISSIAPMRILIPRSTNITISTPIWPKLKPVTRKGSENKENIAPKSDFSSVLVDSPFGTRRVRVHIPQTPVACMDARVKMELEMLRMKRAVGRGN